jgi:D-glycero-D-manno-heptose 1,7-bisphosphate phosphatase
MNLNLRPAVFLDRDGVLNEEVGYLARLEDVRLLPGAAESVKSLNDAGFVTVVVTNQSGVARGYFTEDHVKATHDLIQTMLAEHGAKIDRFEYCPFHPTDGLGVYRRETTCRKPQPGMLLRAAAELGIDLAQSWIIGDRLSDVEAGFAAGCQGSFLVRTGYGSQVELPADSRAVAVADVSEAVEIVLASSARKGTGSLVDKTEPMP